MFAATLAVVGVAMFGDALLPVLPGEVVMLGAVTRAGGDALAVAALVGVAAIGSLLGQYAAFHAGRRVRRARVVAPQAPRARRWPRRALLVAGFVPAGRVAAATAYGVTGGDERGFWRCAAVGSVLSATYLAAIGEVGRRAIGDAWWAPLVVAAALVAVTSSVLAVVRRARRGEPPREPVQTVGPEREVRA